MRVIILLDINRQSNRCSGLSYERNKTAVSIQVSDVIQAQMGQYTRSSHSHRVGSGCIFKAKRTPSCTRVINVTFLPVGPTHRIHQPPSPRRHTLRLAELLELTTSCSERMRSAAARSPSELLRKYVATRWYPSSTRLHSDRWMLSVSAKPDSSSRSPMSCRGGGGRS